MRPELGMRAHQPVAHRLHRHALVGQELGEAELAARIDQRMLADQILDLGLGRRRRARRRPRACRRTRCCRPSVVTMRPLRIEYLAGTTRNEASECHSRLPSDAMRRLLSRASLLAFLVEVGDVGEGRVEAQLRTAHRRVGALLERAEIAREGELLLVADVLAGQDEHGVPVHAGVDRRRPRPASAACARRCRSCGRRYGGVRGSIFDRHGTVIGRDLLPAHEDVRRRH